MPFYQLTIEKFQKKFEEIAPRSIAWEKDNIGLLIGRNDDRIKNILVALDLTMDVAVEAKKKNVNCIVTHHPLLFHPLKNITDKSRVGELVLFLIENKINLYAAHTNLDSVKWGVNFVLAKKIDLLSVEVLSPLKNSLVKISVFVPNDFVQKVADAMHDAGAGTFTKYDHCSFRIEGTGTFRGMNDAKPFLGKVGTIERANEIRLEMLVENWKIGAVISAMLKMHPYEEVAYDIYPLLNQNSEYGIGAIGNLLKKLSQREFLSLIKKKLNIQSLRFTGKTKSIQRVAVCGGSGSEHIADAIAQGADAMVTADLKYHTFQDFENKILLVDAGHYETEQIVLPALTEQIKKIFKQHEHSGKVFVTQHSTNPVHIF